MKEFRAVSVVKYGFTLAGVIVLLVANHIYTGTRAFLDSTVNAEGLVTDMIKQEYYDGIQYRPVVSFRTPSGEKIVFHARTSSFPAAYRVGEEVDVLYNPDEPDKARIKSFSSIWATTWIIGFMGSVFTLSGLALLIGSYLARRHEREKARG